MTRQIHIDGEPTPTPNVADVGRPPEPGEIRFIYQRRGRYMEIQVGVPRSDEERVFGAHVTLADLMRMLHMSTAEVLAASAEANAADDLPFQDALTNPAFVEMRNAALPADCTGKSVLDIGGYDGEMAAECLRRGAASALVYDNGEYLDYNWARPVLKPGVDFQRGDLLAFGSIPPKSADIVLLYNVIYHVRDPWSAIERCRLLTRETFVICTPFLPGDETDWRLQGVNDHQKFINERHTIYWRPTLPGIRRLLELCGFVIDEEVGPVGDHICLRCH